MQRVTILLFSLFFIASLSVAQDKTSEGQDNGSRTNMVEKWEPIDYHPDATTAIFTDDMNGDNTVPGIQARGWFFDDVDGAGTTTTFQGNTAVFNAYEGPPTGYLGENFNGAFNGGLLIDQWLISPAMVVAAGDTVKFWQRSPDGSTFPDPLQVWVSSTAGTNHTAFDIQLGSFTGSTTGWQQYKYVIPVSGNIRFAVRYYTTNGGPSGSESDYIGLDYFEVVTGGAPCPVGAPTNPSPANGAINVPVSGNTATWTNGAGTTNVEVWFGEVGNLVQVYNGAAIASFSLAPVEPLNYFTDYGWRIVCKDATCSTQGPTWTFTTVQDPNLQVFFCDDFTAGSGNWTITNDGGTAGCIWEVFNPPFPNLYTLPPTSSGAVFAADVDDCGTSGTTMLTTATITTPIDASMYQNVWIEFDNDWNILDAQDEAHVEVSTNGGTTWVGVWDQIGVDIRNTHEIVDITSQVALTTFLVRFRSVQPGWDWWWAVDNVCIYGTDMIPVELASFAATANFGVVELQWITATETNNQGFEVQRSAGGEFETIAFVNGHGTTTEIQAYSYTDRSVAVGSYGYRLKQVDFDGTFEYSNVIEADVPAPAVFALDQNYPNPFNPSTKITFQLAVDSKVSLKVFDILGQEVTALVNTNLVAGSHNVNFDASSLNSGVYFYRIEATGIDGTNFVDVKKMILTK